MAATTGSAAASRRHIFPFFSLPRELRDAVYEDATLLTDRVQELPFEGVALKTEAMRPNLLSINRQFRSEYIEANKKKPDLATLTLTTIFVDAEGRRYISLPSWTATMTTIKFNLAYIWDSLRLSSRRMEMTQTKWHIEDCIKQLAQVEDVHIRLNIHDDHQHPFIRQQLEEKFIDIPHLRSLKVWDYGDADDWIRVDANHVRHCVIDEAEPLWDPMLEWDKEKKMCGWRTEVEHGERVAFEIWMSRRRARVFESPRSILSSLGLLKDEKGVSCDIRKLLTTRSGFCILICGLAIKSALL